jgi:hypothetical protein
MFSETCKITSGLISEKPEKFEKPEKHEKHEKPGKPGMRICKHDIDIKLNYVVDVHSGERINVVEEKNALCSCGTHYTIAYFLENEYICIYCEKEKDHLWYENQKEKVTVNSTSNCHKNESVNKTRKRTK